MKGRKKTPAKVLQLRNIKNKGRINLNEPQFEPKSPECPAFLNDRARHYWDLLVSELLAVGIIARVDLGILAAYSTALATLERAETEIQKHGYNGYIQLTVAGEKKSPWVLIAKESRDQIRSLGSELGLTPASRARLKASPPPKDKLQGARKFLA